MGQVQHGSHDDSGGPWSDTALRQQQETAVAGLDQIPPLLILLGPRPNELIASRIDIERASSTGLIDRRRKRRPGHDIFCATLRVAFKRGFGKVTLDAFAAQAGLSKGGSSIISRPKPI